MNNTIFLQRREVKIIDVCIEIYHTNYSLFPSILSIKVS